MRQDLFLALAHVMIRRRKRVCSEGEGASHVDRDGRSPTKRARQREIHDLSKEIPPSTFLLDFFLCSPSRRLACPTWRTSSARLANFTPPSSEFCPSPKAGRNNSFNFDSRCFSEAPFWSWAPSWTVFRRSRTPPPTPKVSESVTNKQRGREG